MDLTEHIQNNKLGGKRAFIRRKLKQRVISPKKSIMSLLYGIKIQYGKKNIKC